MQILRHTCNVVYILQNYELKKIKVCVGLCG